MSDLSITTHEDGSITITETDLTGKRLSVTYPPDAAHAELVRRGAQCNTIHTPDHRVKVTPSEFRTVEFDELSPSAQREVAEHAVLTDVKLDKAERLVIHEQLDVLWARRELLVQDPFAENRNELLDEIDESLKMYRERLIFLDVLIGSADEPYDSKE